MDTQTTGDGYTSGSHLFQDAHVRFVTIMLLLCIDALVVFYVVSYSSPGSRGIDFALFYQGALSLRAGQNPLQTAASWVAHYHSGRPLRGDLYVYPPAFTLLYVPLTFLSFSTALAVWTVCQLVLVVLAVYALFCALRQQPSFLLLTATTSLVLWPSPVRAAILFGQMEPLALCGLACALWARQKHHPVVGGILLGLVAAPKPGLLVVAAVWLWKRELTLAMSTGLSFLVVLVAPVPWLGLAALTELVSVWRFWSTSFLPILYNQSFKGLLARLFTPNAVIHPLANAPLLMTILWLLLVAVVVVLLTCRIRQRPLDAIPLCLLEVGLTLNAMLLIAPLTEQHYLTLLALAFVALVAAARDRGAGAQHRRTAFFAAAGVWVLWSLPLDGPERLLYGAMLTHPAYARVLEVVAPLYLYEMIVILAVLLWAVGRLSGQSWRSAVRATLSGLADLLPMAAFSMLLLRAVRILGSESVETVESHWRHSGGTGESGACEEPQVERSHRQAPHGHEGKEG